ncbi:MAG: restriction endonuclease subunit S [Flavobacteriales bacterium]|nr:restriction endonuclease subunit S [Flavobacteriales bacterium]
MPLLSELSEMIVDCEHKTAPVQEDGYPSIRTPNIGRGYFILDGVNRVSEETYRAWTKRAIPKPGDLIMAREAPVGNVAMIPEGLEPCLGQRTLLIRPDLRKVDPAYLTYLLLGDEVQSSIHAKTNGSTVPHLNMKDVRELPIPELPDLPIQRRIAGILSAYDELIANNQRRIAILEEMARALYREWFVYFRAPGMSAEASAKADVVMGEDGVPEGWEVKRLGEIADIEKGLSYKGEFLEDEGGTPMVNLKCINPGGGFRRDGTKGYSGPYKDRQSVKPGDIVFANTDLTQAGGIIGSAALVPRAGFEQGGLATHHICIARPRSYMVCNTLLYFILGDERFKDFAKGRASGTTVLGFRTGDAEDYSAIIPPRDLAKAFDEKVSPMLDLVETLHEKTANLRRTRDLLLPRLMSGRVEVEPMHDHVEAE